MKKLLAFILVIMLLPTFAIAEFQVGLFEAACVKALGLSVEQTISNRENRAWLVAALICDILENAPEISLDLSFADNAYIGKYESVIALYVPGHHDVDYWLAVYPDLGFAGHNQTSKMADYLIESTLDLTWDVYYKTDNDLIAEVLEPLFAEN